MVTGSRGRRNGRGQTLQDFTIGILVFILTVTLVLTTILGHVNPYWTGVGSDETSQAERIAETITAEFSTGADPTELDAERLRNDIFTQTVPGLRGRWDLERSTNLFIEVRTVDGSTQVVHDGDTLAVGGGSEGQTTARRTRLVTLTTPACDPSCRLVVEVW